MTGHRIGLDLFSDVLDVLRRHGFAGGDDLHAGRAIFLIGVLARIYDGSRDHPNRPSTSQPPRAVRPAGRPSPGRPGRRHAHPRGGQDRPDGTGPRRPLETRPGREMHLIRRPVLLQMPTPPPLCPHPPAGRPAAVPRARRPTARRQAEPDAAGLAADKAVSQ